MLLAQASMRIRLGEWLLIWPKTPSVCMRVRCPQESLAQAGQFLRLGSLAHPLYIILAFSNTVSCCTNFWRLLGGPGGLSERTSQILRIQIFRGGKWKMTGFQSGKRCWKYQSMESFPSFWLLLIYNTVGTRCGSSCQRESEDTSKATAGSLKKLKEVQLPIGKVGAEQPSNGAWTAITWRCRFLLLARNPCPLFSGSNRVQCLPLGHPLVGSSFLQFSKIQAKVSCNGSEVMLRWHGVTSHGHWPESSWSDLGMVLSF